MYPRQRKNFLNSVLQMKDLKRNLGRRQNGYANSSKWERSEKRQSTEDTATDMSFSENTTIHGIRYLTERNRPFYEKIFWFAIMVFVCYWMVKTIANQIRNYLNNPVLMNIDGESIQITDIPFPALTFCSDNQVHPSIVNINDLLNKQNRTDDEYDKLEIGLTLCSELKLRPTLLLALQRNKTLADLTTRLRMYGAGNCKRIFKAFLWEQEPFEKPCEYFQVTMTPKGICYTFNMLPAKQLYTEDYYKDLLMLGLLLQDYKYFQSENIWDPESGYMAGDRNGFEDGGFPWTLSSMKFQLIPVVLLLNFNADDMDPLCVSSGHTFTVAIHNPAEPPTAYSTIAQAVTDRGNYIRIVPRVVTTSKELQSWSPKDRGCYFNDEKKLKYFKIYTMHNCEIECETNITLKECNCTFFDQPHFHSTPTCKPNEMECFKEGLVQTLDTGNRETNNCNCLPSCTELKYDVEYFNVPDKFMDFGQAAGNIPRNTASFYAMYKTTRIKSVQRVAVVITSDIIANIGGLMGLFLGFSVLSLFEIVYFFMHWVIRIFKSIWK